MIVSKYHIPHSHLRLKIAVLADIHDRPITKAIAEVKAEKPNLIVIPGDLLTGHLTKDAWDTEESHFGHEKRPWKTPTNAVRLLRELCAIAPTYFSLGNHEHAWNALDIAFAEELGVHVLKDCYERISAELLIGGLTSRRRCDEKVSSCGPDESWLRDFAAEQGYKILLMHEPQLWPKVVRNHKIDLTISGHAHGGQWRFFGFGVFSPGQGLFPKLTKGFYFQNRLLVSAGLSNTAPIPRLFNPTELVIVTIGSNKR